MSRKIIVADSLKWLAGQPNGSISNVVTGICDMGETQMTMDQYLDFFRKVSGLIFKKLNPKGYAIFIQTDRKYQRSWIDKSYILTSMAQQAGFKMVWHKIVLHRGVGRTDLHRPTYAHMLCYTKTGNPGAAFPDVIDVSKKLYKNATPLEAARLAIEFVKKNSKAGKTVLDPFVGRGTVVALANQVGLDAIGIDIDPVQAKKAELA